MDDSVRRRAEYSSDASNYRVVPTVVAFPRHVDEAAAALAVARQLGVPVTCRGAGTSIAGNAVGTGLVLDFSRHLNRVLAVDPQARTAVVEPGAILDDITAAAAGHGLRFGPDPSTHARATIGGSIGNNACGSRALRYGRTADNVVSLDLLTASGERLAARRFGRDGLAAAGPAGVALDALVADRLSLIRTEFGRFTRQVSGYSLEHLLPENGADLAKFLRRHRGHARPGRRGDGAAGRVAEGGGAGRARLPRHAGGRRRGARPAAAPPGGARGHGRAAGRGRPRPPRRAPPCPACPAGQAGCSSRPRARPRPRRGRRPSALIADGGALDAAVVTGAPARALWRIREDGAGLGGRTPAGRAGLARLGRRRRPAPAPGRVPA